MGLIGKLRSWIDRHFGIIALMPAVVGLCFVLIYPVITSINWSFTNRFLIRPTWRYIGLENFQRLLREPEVFVSLRNGVVYTASTVILQLIFAMIIALLLHRGLKGQNLFRLLLMIPWTFPVIVTVMVWGWLLHDSHGFINHFLMQIGLIDLPIPFLASSSSALASVIAVHAWSGIPLMMTSILAGFQSIPNDFFEVARIEGAKGYQTFWYVMLPMVKPILRVIITLRCIWIFNNFNLIFLLTGGGPGTATQNLPILAYKYGWDSMLVGRSSAVSVIILLFLAIAFGIYVFLFGSKKEDANIV
jgi:multiple sugar transport system permease protein